MDDIWFNGAGSGAFGSGTGDYGSLAGSGVPSSGSLSSGGYDERYLNDLFGGLADGYRTYKSTIGQIPAVAQVYRNVQKYPAIRTDGYLAATARVLSLGGEGSDPRYLNELMWKAGLPVINPANLSPTGQVVTTITHTRSNPVSVPLEPAKSTVTARSSLRFSRVRSLLPRPPR